MFLFANATIAQKGAQKNTALSCAVGVKRE